MKRSNLILVPFAIPMIGLDVALVITGKLTPVGLISTLGAFAAVVFVYWFFNLRGQRVEKDERTIRLARKAMAYSWLFTIYLVVLLSASDSLGLLRLSGLQYLGIVTMVMTFSYLILHLAMNRKGDVE
jgi:hypothetical protein